eukprot:TRINITY_DN12378_c0_g1_i1.p1 TRINITY_DN12378_c0_g1~~TRINITY_DN12378_c0_g1_i1.p1  ORF type:complete len:804 (+),score=155.89 TRINITY_DN12378_c0_g1_i1:218-2413(+)
MGGLTAATELFKGSMDEVRVWQRPRLPEQITDNIFSRVKGERASLAAYYSFDAASTTKSATALLDGSLVGNHLTWSTAGKPTIVLSTAPVSQDTAIVRGFGTVRTVYHEMISGSPAVGEYGDVQSDGKGNMTGVMKRCYSYVQSGEWGLITGYKVGNLITEWVGQCQFAPQIIGFIEGPPPVPSENFTINATDVITEENSVSLETADNVTVTVGSSKESSSRESLSFGAAFNSGSSDLLITAPFGIGIAKSMDEITVSAKVGRGVERESGWANEQSFGSSQEVARTVKNSLQGTWENTAALLNSELGQRYVPRNYGMALVQSSTADIFSLRLEHNRALVAFRMMPNPDIPADWNLIPFPLNPRYTKNGTLDGRVGYDSTGGVVLDSDYKNAASYGEYSYYKPKEAYALKNQIIRQQQRMSAVYDKFSTDGTAGTIDSGNGLGLMQKFVPDLKTPTTAPKMTTDYSKRNICNTYVWSADGGFFAEATQLSDVASETISGSRTITTDTSVGFSVDFSIFSIGTTVEMDASWGGSMTVTRAKTKESSTSFGVNVELNVPGRSFMQKLDKTTGKPVFDATNNPVWQPGKVDAYRFNTYYLEPAKSNFEDFFNKVVDPVWLKGTDPNAVALMQANQAESKPPCWRIFHRVTFVSRILPPIATLPANPTLEASMKSNQIDSNWQLLQRLTPVVADKATVADFSDAIRDYIKTYLPALQIHTKTIIMLTADYLGFSLA